MRSYCLFQQDDWAELLLLAEYAYNSAVLESIKVFAFCVNYGFESRTNWPKASEGMAWDNPASQIKVSQWQAIWEALQANLGKAKLRMVKWYDKHTQEAPEYKPRDEVMLDRRNIQTKHLMNKLNNKKFGPFKVLEAVGKRAYRLKLPQNMEIHPVFHTSLLEPYKAQSDPQRKVPPPIPEDIERKENWVIREVVDSRVNKKKKKVGYLILWEGL